MEERSIMKQKFYDCLSAKETKNNSFNMSTEKYNSLIEEVNLAKSANKKLNRYYWLLRHYDVISVDGKDNLIAPRVNEQVLYYITYEELFNVLYDTHLSIGHGGRDRMRTELKQRYKNITIQDIQTFLNICEPCLKKRSNEKRSMVVKPVNFPRFNSRCQVDLIDYQSQADEPYKFIMVYQDILTKFIILRALKSQKAEEIAQQLLDIFLLFGAPAILQSDNGPKLCNNIIDSLQILWPELKIIQGMPLPSESQGSVVQVNQEVENILRRWMKDNNCNNWGKGLSFVQFTKNQTLHAGIQRSPFEAMFGQPAKIGLASSMFPKDIIQNIKTENELEKILQNKELFEEPSLLDVMLVEEEGEFLLGK